jgi:hypothetical protein
VTVCLILPHHPRLQSKPVSRRRYISTLVSVDKTLRACSDSAVMFYLMMLPHVEDDATITGDPDELAAIVVPNRPGWTAGKLRKVLDELEDQNLFVIVDGTLYLPPVSFYKYQSRIPEGKRRTEHPVSEKPCSDDVQKIILKVAENSASPSPSPSPSPSKHMRSDERDFARFYSLYPRKKGPGQAEKAWNTAVRSTPAEEIIAGLRRQLPALMAQESRYVKHPATWLNGKCWLDEDSCEDSELDLILEKNRNPRRER